MKKQQFLKTTNKNPRNSHDYDDEDEGMSQLQLGYFVNSKTFHQYTVPLDEDIIQPSYYRAVVQALEDANEGDTFIFKVASRGGALAGLQVLLEGIKNTQAHTVAMLVGQCASAASIFTLHCDTVIVTDSADMLAHFVSYTTGGKGADIVSHVAHVAKTSEKLIRSTYEHFLSESEINAIIDGKEMYLDADEIRERLSKREDIREAEFLAEQAQMGAEQKALEDLQKSQLVTAKGKAAKPK